MTDLESKLNDTVGREGVEKGVKAVKGIKDTVDSLTGKTAMTDAMNAPISADASGKEKK